MDGNGPMADFPDPARGLRYLRWVQTAGFIVGGANLVLFWGRFQALGFGHAVYFGAAALAALVAASLVTTRARFAYWLFIAAAFASAIDMMQYAHAMFFLGCYLVIGSLSAILEPDEDGRLHLSNPFRRSGS